VRSIKEECLDRKIFVGQGALRRAVTEFVAVVSKYSVDALRLVFQAGPSAPG
jgi:hypothetical protein